MSEDEINNRLSRRLGGDAGNDQDESDDAPSEENAMNAENDVHVRNPWDAERVKSAWNGMTFYLPDAMKDRLDTEYQRLTYECDFEFLKDRHLKPLVIEHGLDAVSEMDPDDVHSALADLEREYSTEE
ncbi:hypothetical protein C5B90_19100 [Haloferax sp. Atlit-12N]|uniref:hypothetical protein n=1 Tax=Haloferax sp. Atlit-12N TaxID=2077203 RepID=UPI000E22B973|nr:hypothetical protein [Haloferax sp. Atlit-12N]RDZ61382.1 hypothetical protein C5B90_19100 [Haloferax sp. Atlit-12N]